MQDGSTFQAYLIGGHGARCPGLLPNSTLRKQKCILFENIFDNGDGILAFIPDEKTPTVARALLTDSGHYLLPIDVEHPQTEKMTNLMLQLIEQRVDKLFQTFSYKRQARVHLHATGSQRREDPEAQNQSEFTVPISEWTEPVPASLFREPVRGTTLQAS